MATNRATKSGFAAEAQRKVSIEILIQHSQHVMLIQFFC